MLVVVVGIWNFTSYAVWWFYVLAMGLEFLYFIVSMNTWLYVWLCGGRRMGVGESFDDYRSVFSCVVKFSTLRNTKETLANFFKIPRVSLFRVPLFLVYAWSSFGSIPTQEARSKRLDVVEAVFTQIWTVLNIVHFSALAAFKPLRDLKRTCR